MRGLFLLSSFFFFSSHSLNSLRALYYEISFSLMDLFNMPLDPFDIIESESLFVPTENPLDDDLNDLIFNQPSTETNTRCFQSSFLRPIDLPSHRKHYGLLSFYHYRIPILFRFEDDKIFFFVNTLLLFLV